MKFKQILLFTILGLGNLLAQDPPAPTPDSEIIALDRQPDGVDIHFTGDPNQLYAVYVSDDNNTWSYLTMGANIEGDLFHVHDPGDLQSKSRFYRIAVLNQDCQQVDPHTTQNLYNFVRYREALNKAQRDTLRQAASDYHVSMNDTRRAIVAVKQAQAALAKYLKSVSAARFTWIAAGHETDAATRAGKAAEKQLTAQKNSLENQKVERDKAIRMRDQQLHEKGVFLDWAKKFDDAGDPVKADEMRANAGAAQERFEEWHAEVAFQEDAIKTQKQDIAESKAIIIDHGKTVTAKTTAEATAKKDYDTKNTGRAPLENAVTEAKQGLLDAGKAQQAKSKAWIDASRKAYQDGKKESERLAALAYAASDDGKAGVPPPAPVAPKPSARAVQIARFLEHIKRNGGLDQYNDALKVMFGASLKAGLVTLKGLGAAMAQWATGKAASGAGVGNALASGTLGFGYGIIAKWVQDATGTAVRGLATNSIAGMIFGEGLNPGDAKYSPGRGRQSATAELYMYNEDGTATVMIFRPSQPLTVKTYRIKHVK